MTKPLEELIALVPSTYAEAVKLAALTYKFHTVTSAAFGVEEAHELKLAGWARTPMANGLALWQFTHMEELSRLVDFTRRKTN
jgi:hypothetical protein